MSMSYPTPMKSAKKKCGANRGSRSTVQILRMRTSKTPLNGLRTSGHAKLVLPTSAPLLSRNVNDWRGSNLREETQPAPAMKKVASPPQGKPDARRSPSRGVSRERL